MSGKQEVTCFNKTLRPQRTHTLHLHSFPYTTSLVAPTTNLAQSLHDSPMSSPWTRVKQLVLGRRVGSQGKRKDGRVRTLVCWPDRQNLPRRHPSPLILQDIKLPLELWRMVFEFLLDDAEHDPTATHGLAAAAAVCRGLQHEAEAALYRRVSIGPSIHQIRTFTQTVSENVQHAAAVKSLRIEIPDLDIPLHLFPENRFRLCTPLPRCPGARRISPITPDYLHDPLCELFQKTVNLAELDFVALDDFPYTLHGATSQLHALRTTHAGLELLHMEENRVIPTSQGQPRRDRYTPLLALDALRALTLNMRGVEYRVQDLQVSFHQYRVTHLALDLAPNRSVARDLLPLLCDTLVSFKMVLAPLTGELSPFQRWSLRFRSDVHLWPTQILDDTVLPVLRHLEICETEYTYHPVSVLPFSLSCSLPSIFHSVTLPLTPLPPADRCQHPAPVRRLRGTRVAWRVPCTAHVRVATFCVPRPARAQPAGGALL